MTDAAILWTGGKDSMMALCAVRERMNVRLLATFTPSPPRPFLAHPLACMRAQAEALGIEHRTLPCAAPLKGAYEAAIDDLASEGIEVLVTGDMDRIEGHDNWIVERARDVVTVERPLWQADRIAVLRRMQALGLRVVCTLAKDAAFPETIAGRELDEPLVEELIARHGRDGFDACGENGEYHTCVCDGPGFARPIELVGARVEQGDGYRHLVFEGLI